MRVVAPAAVFLGSAALVASCGDTVSLDPVAKAADSSAGQTSEHMDLAVTMQVAGKTVSMTANGDFQNKPLLGGMSLSMDGAGQNVSIREIMDGQTIYMSSNLFASQLPSGKSWIAIDLANAAKAGGVDLGSIESSSPTSALEKLRTSGGVAKIGTDTIGGVTTTYYRAVLDPGKVDELTKKTGLTVRYEPVDVWIDGQGLVRRMHMRYSVGATTSSQTVSADMTINLSQYGEAVTVTPPSPSETFTAPENGGTS